MSHPLNTCRDVNQLWGYICGRELGHPGGHYQDLGNVVVAWGGGYTVVDETHVWPVHHHRAHRRTAVSTELPAYATKAIQPLVDALPRHAHIDQTARSWKAQWTTDTGLWVVHFRWPSLDPDEVTVTGPGLELKHDRPYGSTLVLAVLAQRGALMAPDETDD